MPCHNSRFPAYPFINTVGIQNDNYIDLHPFNFADCKFNPFVDFTSNETIAGAQSKTDRPLQG
jgi:phosphoserine aminotransferase